MGAFTIMITNKGKALQAKAQTGVELQYTRFRVGDGQLGGRPISDLTGLINPVMSLPISKLQTRPGGRAVVGTVMTNKDVTSGFYFRELGIYAQDPDVGEILYCYGNAGETADYIPAKGGSNIIEEPIDISTIVGNASNVTAGIDESLVWASHDDVAKCLADSKAYTDQKVKDIDLSKITPDSIGAAKKADLDTLQKNSVSIKTSASKDFNTYREPGLYHIGSMSDYTNSPSNDGGFSWGILRVESLGSTAYVKQTYTCVVLNATFVRSKAEDASGRAWEPWRRSLELDKDGILRLQNWLDISGEGSLLNLHGKTHVFIAFLKDGARRGYVGMGDPKSPNNVTLSSDGGSTLIHAGAGDIHLNAAAGGVFAQGRNILGEIDQLKTSGVNAKQGTVDALNAKGQPASTNDEWPTLHQKIRQITTGVPYAKVKMTVTRSASFKPYEDATVSSGLYYVIVTGLNFTAKGIYVLGSHNSKAYSSYDSETSPRAYVTGSINSYTVVYRDTLPQTGFDPILATVTPTSFIFPVSYLDEQDGMDATVIAYG